MKFIFSLVGVLKIKRIIIFLLILLIPAIVFAEVVRKVVKKYPDGGINEVVYYSYGEEIAREIFDKEGNIISKTGKIPDGVVKEYYESGELLKELSFKNDNIEGISKYYYENGNLRSKENYKNGELDGVSIDYYENGNLQSEWSFKNGKLEGISKYYHENGSLKAELNYKNGRIEGIGKFYNNKGYLRAEFNYKNDIRDGLNKLYYENGNLRSEFNYKNGKLEGISKKYYKNGGIRFIYTYKNGEMANRIAYDKNSKLIDKKWKLIVEKVDNSHFIDTKTISYLSGNIVRVWVKNITDEGNKSFLEKQEILKESGKNYVAYSHTVTLFEIDCSKNMDRILSEVYYGKDGGVIDPYSSTNSKWNFIVHGSIGEELQKSVCKEIGKK